MSSLPFFFIFFISVVLGINSTVKETSESTFDNIMSVKPNKNASVHTDNKTTETIMSEGSFILPQTNLTFSQENHTIISKLGEDLNSSLNAKVLHSPKYIAQPGKQTEVKTASTKKERVTVALNKTTINMIKSSVPSIIKSTAEPVLKQPVHKKPLHVLSIPLQDGNSDEKEDDGASQSQPRNSNTHPEMVMPLVISVLVVPMFAILGYMALKRGQEAWKNRHYKRMDFLLDGMYND